MVFERRGAFPTVRRRAGTSCRPLRLSERAGSGGCRGQASRGSAGGAGREPLAGGGLTAAGAGGGTASAWGSGGRGLAWEVPGGVRAFLRRCGGWVS